MEKKKGQKQLHHWNTWVTKTVTTEDCTKLSELLSEGFKRRVYRNKYKVMPDKKEVGTNNDPKYIKKLLDSSHQGVKRLLIFAYDNTDNDIVTVNSHQKYLLPKVKIENRNIEIDGINFNDQPNNDLIRQYEEVRKVPTGQGDDCTTGCLLDFG